MSVFSLWSFLFGLCMLAVTARSEPKQKPFGCTGGVVYFSAHPVDGLLFQNPDLLHDLYVFKCVTTVVFTSGDRGETGDSSLSLERGLQQAYALMADLPVSDPTQEEATVRIGTHDVHSWSLRGMPNIQIIFLRLPDGLPSGQGYDAHAGASLAKLYKKEIDSITSTDGLASYTLRDLKELIAYTLHMRQPNDVRILDHNTTLARAEEHHEYHDHTDHIVSAKLVQTVVTGENIRAKVHAYAGNVVRNFEANIKSTDRDYTRKTSAFFKYAEYDEFKCQSLSACKRGLAPTRSLDDHVQYAAQYLHREYYVMQGVNRFTGSDIANR